MSTHPEGSGAAVDELLDAAINTDYTADLERLRAATYTGRDPDHLVTAVVNGHGVVARIRFGATVERRGPAQVEEAIRIAVDAAQAGASRAWQQFAARVEAANAPLVAAAERAERELADLQRQAEEVWARVPLVQ
jgi:hypothetical protein